MTVKPNSKKQQVLYWLSEGYTQKEICHELDITLSNVQAVLTQLRKQFKAKDNDELITQALIAGVLKKRRDINNGL